MVKQQTKTSARSSKLINDVSLSELRVKVGKLAKRNNRRMLDLERRGVQTQAYQTASHQLKLAGRNIDKPRFKEYTKNLTERELRKELRLLEAHELRTTKTITGHRKALAKTAETFGIKYELDDQESVQLLNLLGELEFKMIQEMLGLPSDVIVAQIKDGIRNSVDIKTAMSDLVRDSNEIVKNKSSLMALRDYLAQGKVTFKEED